jgi:redox-sensitive bicupin YhaK (pirin superfamily)
MEGFQLWLNLPSKDKMRDPWYRDIQSEEIPELRTPEGVNVRVIAGESHGVQGSMQRDVTLPLYLDLHFEAAGQRFEQPLPRTRNAFVCVYRGSVEVVGADGEATLVERGRMALLTNEGDGVVLRAAGGEPARAILIAGQPLREPIAQYGPFVMNTKQQLIEAVEDFNNGRLA